MSRVHGLGFRVFSVYSLGSGMRVQGVRFRAGFSHGACGVYGDFPNAGVHLWGSPGKTDYSILLSILGSS